MTPTDRWRRRAGLFFLGASLLLLLGGFSPPGAALQGVTFLLYWLACAAFAVLALATALLDLVIIRSRGRSERRELAQATAEEIRAALRQSGSEQGPDRRPPTA